MDFWTVSLRILLFPSALGFCSDLFHSECYTVNGADYRGTQNQTSLDNGKPCLFWNETFQHPYNTLKYPNGEGGLGEHNYCRNPDGDVSPWCYISENEDSVYWKYCDIPTCRMPGNLGCFKDHGNPPPLTGITETSNKQTIQTCINMCRRQRYKFAGLESGFACFCGNNADYRKHGETPSTDCNSVCFGDHTQPCGGDGRIILFDSLVGACGGNYTMDSAVIYSPDFPDTYGTGKACYWTIQVPGATVIHFNFTFFDIKDSRDMVELLDGYTKQVLVRFDGRNHPSHSFNISLDFVILYFFSDRVNQAQGFAVVYQAFKDQAFEKPKTLINQTQTELITQTTNLSINAARSSKILYVITTSPSRPTGHMPGWTVYALTALLILTILAILTKALLHITMKSPRLSSPTSLDSCHRGSTGEIWSIFYKPSTSISIFPKKIKSPHDDRNPLVGE